MATTAPYADHEIVVNLVPGGPGSPGHAVPTITNPMGVGETVYYSSPDGAVRIEFVDGTPFVDSNGNDITVITDKVVLPLTKQGTFTCRCFITLASGTTVGWVPNENPQSGGNHVVK
jgi:hypothetical protein